MSKITIFLDYDDVIVDWATQACKTFNLDLNDPEVRTQIENIWGGIDKWVPHTELWEKIHAIGMDWWADLPVLPWANRLYDEMTKLGRVVFLTAPSDHWSCVAGKHVSISKHFGTRDFLMGKPKEEAARFDRILVDDRPENCDKFFDNDGNTFLWPSALKLQRLGCADQVIDQLIQFVDTVKTAVETDCPIPLHCIPTIKDAE